MIGMITILSNHHQMIQMLSIMKHCDDIFIQPDERDGESEHDEPGHAGYDEHEQWHAGIISFVLRQGHLRFRRIISDFISLNALV